MNNEADQLVEAAHGFVRNLEQTDRDLRRAGTTVPPAEVKEQVAGRFWSLVALIDRFTRESRGENGEAAIRRACCDIVGPWLFRSRFFNRSFHKPHGHAGDFRMVEWMYDLEGAPCNDPTQPGIVNCLDQVFATVHSVQAVWERRHRFAQLLRREHDRQGGHLRILDVACGGSRYTADFLATVVNTSGNEVTLVDQDAAALAYCQTVSLARWQPLLRTICLPIKRLAEALSSGEFDVVVSAGLFDYLNDETGRALLSHLVRLTTPGGITAIANFHPADPSRNVKDWLVDWPLIFRGEAELVALFPESLAVETSLSENGSLAYATARRPILGLD